MISTVARPRYLRDLMRFFDDQGGKNPRRAERAVVLLLHLGAIRWT
jgi:hypothetical protein